METITIENQVEELKYAKKAVQSILDDSNTSVDFHGLSYWAERVESLRNLITNSL